MTASPSTGPSGMVPGAPSRPPIDGPTQRMQLVPHGNVTPGSSPQGSLTQGSSIPGPQTELISKYGEVREWQRANQLDELLNRHAVLCANAVDAMEITAGLEADGLNDRIVQKKYGYSDVFALAED